MTTRSPFDPDRPGISPESVADAPAAPPPAPFSAAVSPPASPDEATDGVERRYADPVDGLVHAAVADRPLEEVLQLIELLEQSPAYARATVDALRAVGTDRSVEDVTRLVTLLTRPPRNADSADEAIRAAAEARPVEDVTRLMALLHRPPLEPHCAEAAVRAAATSRPVEELVQLIGRMAQEQDVRAQPRRTETGESEAATSAADGPDGPPLNGPPAERGAVTLPARARRDRTSRNGPAWPRLVAAMALVVCGLAHLPPHRGGASSNAYGFALGASALCVLLGLTLFRANTGLVLVLGIMIPAALAAAQLLEGRLHSPGLSHALDITAAPPWLAGLTALFAASAALTALLAFLSAARLGPQPEERPTVGANRAAD